MFLRRLRKRNYQQSALRDGLHLANYAKMSQTLNAMRTNLANIHDFYNFEHFQIYKIYFILPVPLQDIITTVTYK